MASVHSSAESDEYFVSILIKVSILIRVSDALLIDSVRDIEYGSSPANSYRTEF